MTNKINIMKVDQESIFFNNGKVVKNSKHVLCPICKERELDDTYITIINRLKDKMLLDKKYQIMCCDCGFIKDNVGTTHCTECNEVLKTILEQRIRSNSLGVKIIILCPKCDKVYSIVDKY